MLGIKECISKEDERHIEIVGYDNIFKVTCETSQKSLTALVLNSLGYLIKDFGEDTFYIMFFSNNRNSLLYKATVNYNTKYKQFEVSCYYYRNGVKQDYLYHVTMLKDGTNYLLQQPFIDTLNTMFNLICDNILEDLRLGKATLE